MNVENMQKFWNSEVSAHAHGTELKEEVATVDRGFGGQIESARARLTPQEVAGPAEV